MIALVTGGNGFVGRYIVEYLLARGDHVRVVGRGTYLELQAQGVETFQADLSLPEAAAVMNVCRILHVTLPLIRRRRRLPNSMFWRKRR